MCKQTQEKPLISFTCLSLPFPIKRCFNGGSCQDGVDSYTCSCPADVSGVNCECGGVAGECINVNDSVSWTVPPFYIEAATEQVRILEIRFVMRSVL